MKKNQIILILILIPWMMKAQLNESFTDGNFTSDPAWIGDTPDFLVNSSSQLQLNSTGDKVSGLATAIVISDSMEWNFWVKQSFSPSDNNYSRVYLMSDQQDLKSPLNGYYLKLGESGASDAIELFSQSGSSVTSLCRGTPGLIATSFAIRIRVIRSKQGSWKIFADPAGGTDFKPEAIATDNTYSAGSWFGVVCKYTSSNSTKFYFDDFYAGPEIIDNSAPELLSVSIMTSNSLMLKFSENVDATTSTNTDHYMVDQGIGQPALVQREEGDPSRVYLAFSSEFISDVSYMLSVTGIRDISGNEMLATQLPFSWHSAHSFDILINEIMCDPDPPVSLPNFEYIELFNRTGFSIDLLGWSITIGSVSKALPAFLLPSGGFVILSDDAAQPYLEAFGPVIPFTSFSLANTGNTLTLRNPGGSIVHSVSYSEDWYQSEYKMNGGWSLELIDPTNPCGEAGNWIVSNDASGGTPGKVNSVNASNPDNQPPVIIRVGISDPFHLKVTFSESLDSTALANPENYSFDNGLGKPLSAVPAAPGYRQVSLLLGAAVEKGTIYTLTISGFFTDCVGNPLPENSSARFALPATAEPSDLVINEILFDPTDNCVDFVEIFNRSSSVVELRELTLACFDTIAVVLSDISEISKESLLVFPGEYYALTSDTAALKQCYNTPNPNGFIQMSDLPSMNDDAGSIALAQKTGDIIDRLTYTSDMQYPLLTNSEGVSLERINPERPASDKSNWHSAAVSVGFATPAYQNSQFGIIPVEGNVITLSPEIFSPDNDGHDDNLNIAYTFSASGYNATVTIYDAAGHLVRNLVNNELCGTSGAWSWDGIGNQRMKAPIGRYIVLVEVFDLQGNVKKYKRTAVLGGYL